MTRTPRRLSDQVVRELVLDTEPFVSCEDCFALVDVYVEAVLAHPHGPVMPHMAAHLAGCPACAEEAQSLLDLVAAAEPEPPGVRFTP